MSFLATISMNKKDLESLSKEQHILLRRKGVVRSLLSEISDSVQKMSELFDNEPYFMDPDYIGAKHKAISALLDTVVELNRQGKYYEEQCEDEGLLE